MIIRIVSFTQKGSKLGKLVKEELSTEYDVEGYTLPRLSQSLGLIPVDNLNLWTRTMFSESNAIVFIGACGIAVRLIAPYIKDKTKDPAVIVIDENGEYIIPILSGHIGGANSLALKIAKRIKGEAVITTATDINNKFSVDSFAVKNNLSISNMSIAKNISAKILENEKIGFISDLSIKGNLPKDLSLENKEIGIVVSIYNKKPFKSTLNLVPKSVYIGIGCRKGTSLQNIEKLVFKVLKENNILITSLKKVCSINIKDNEKGLIEFSEKHGLEFQTFTAKELLKVKGEFTKSEFVESITGVDNVCERSAMALGDFDLIVKKTCGNGVTVALAMEKGEIKFEY